MIKQVKVEEYDYEMKNLENKEDQSVIIQEQSQIKQINNQQMKSNASFDSKLNLSLDQEIHSSHHYNNNNMNSNGLESYLGKSNMVRLNIDTTNNTKVSLIFLAFTVLMVVTYICTLAVPDSYVQNNTIIQKCPFNSYNNKILSERYCQYFESKTQFQNANIIQGLSNLNQFLFMSMNVVPFSNYSSNSNISLSLKLQYKINILFMDSTFSQVSYEYNGLMNSQSTQCKPNQDPFCSNINLVYLQQIQQDTILFTIDILNSDILSPYIKQINYSYFTVNPQFTKFILILRYLFNFITFIFINYIFRYICLFFTIISNFYFHYKTKLLPKSEWVIEQKMLVVLGIALLLFNDPFMAITLLLPNLASSFFSTFWQINFVTFLLLFWIVVFDSIIIDNNQKVTKAITRPKIILTSTFWIISFVFYLIIMFLFEQNPTQDLDYSNNNGFMVFLVFYIMILIIYGVTIINFYLKCCKKYKSLIGRHQIFFMFSSYFIVVMFIFLFSISLSINYYNSISVFLTVTVSNFYIWFMQYLYAPSTKGLLEFKQLVLYNNINPNPNAMYDYLQENEDDELTIHLQLSNRQLQNQNEQDQEDQEEIVFQRN